MFKNKKLQKSLAVLAIAVFCLSYLNVFVPTVFAVEEFSDDFESNSFTSWTGTTGSPQTVGSPVAEGSYAMEADGSGDTAYETLSSNSEYYAGCYVRFSGLPASGEEGPIFLKLNNGETEIGFMYLTYDTQAKWSLRFYDGWLQTATSTVSYPAINTWYWVELRVKASGTVGEFEVWVDDVELTDLEQTGCNTGQTAITRVIVGSAWDDFFVTTHIDKVIVDTEAIGEEDPPVTPPSGQIPLPYSLIGEDYLLYSLDGDPYVWWTSVRLNKLIEYNSTVMRAMVTFPNASKGSNGVFEISPFDEIKFGQFLDIMWDNCSVKVIIDCHNVAGDLYGYYGSQDFIDTWAWIAGLYKDDDRVVGYNIANEPIVQTWATGISNKGEFMQSMIDTIDAIRDVDPDIPIFYPIWYGCGSEMDYVSVSAFYEDAVAYGLTGYPNIIYDTIHPYFFENSWDMGMTPTVKASWYVTNYLVPYVDYFGYEYCWVGETFAWQQEGFTESLQVEWVTAIINECLALDVGFQILTYFPFQNWCDQGIDASGWSSYSYPLVVVDEVLYDYWNTYDLFNSYAGGQYHIAQTFTTSQSYNVTSVRLKMFRLTAGQTMVVSIQTTSANVPTGTILVSDSTSTSTITPNVGGEWVEFNFDSGYVLSGSTKYAIVVNCTGTTSYSWRATISYDIDYSGGTACHVNDAGDGVWYQSATRDRMFEVWGLSGVAPDFYVQVLSLPELNPSFLYNGSIRYSPTTIGIDDGDYVTLISEDFWSDHGLGYAFSHWIINATTNVYTQSIDYTITGNTNMTMIWTLITEALYTFYGPFHESTGIRVYENVTVQVYHSDPSPVSEFVVNGTSSIPYSDSVLFFKFTFNDTSVREYWLDPSETVTNIFIFWDTTTTYAINFLDYTGILDTYSFVTAKTYVNGSLYTVEKRKVDSQNNILMDLVLGTKYQVTVGNEDYSQVWGELLMTSDTSVQLTINAVDFPKETLLMSKNIRIYGYREFAEPNGSITIIYADLLNMTTSVSIEIYNGSTLVYSVTISATYSFTHVWTIAYNATSYTLRASVIHTRYGTMDWNQYFPSEMGGIAPFALNWLGSLPFETSTLIPSLIILFVAGCFSAINAHVGAVLTCIVSIMLTWIGWIAIPVGALIGAFSFAILMGLIYSRRRVTTY